MSLAYTCDYCGQPIDDDELFAAIEARGHFPSEHDISDGRYQSDALGHYHTEARGDEPACYQRVRDALDLVREFAPMLAALPTTDELANDVTPLPASHDTEGRWVDPGGARRSCAALAASPASNSPTGCGCSCSTPRS
jgi:hypothetical protein